MYVPAHFQLSDDDALAAATERGFGTMVVARPEGFEVSPLPFLVDREDDGTVRVRAHVARPNPLAALLADGLPAVMVVTLADGYVSPRWYPSKAEHHRVVPTWNYVAVQLHGTARAVTDTAWLRDLVTRLTDRHEASMATPWSVDDAPPDYIDATLRSIVGIELHVTRIEGKAKLSQNRSDADARAVERAERSAGRTDLADRMAVALGEESE